jgi:guanylate kinase
MLLKHRRVRQPGQLIILSGPSGSGKTTLHDLLLRSPRFRGQIIRSVSATTRKPRKGEKDGRDYFFLSPKMFEYKIRSGQLLEWARVFDQYYGTPLKNVHDKMRSGKTVLLCIDVQGARQVKRKMPQACSIFVKTSSLAGLRWRLLRRGTDSREAVALRIKTAAKELKEARQYDHVIVNDDLNCARQELEQVVGQALGM